MCDKIYEIVKKFIKESKVNKSDIWQIVHIFDTDGTYVPNSAVVLGNTKDFFYSTTQISCKNPERIIKRNEKKRKIMNFLLCQQEIKNIPYIGYYMSSNLDHVLYNEQNLPEELKIVFADTFYEELRKKPELFIDFLEEVGESVPNSFPVSWGYIKEGLHSLERHTNLHIYFKQNPFK